VQWKFTQLSSDEEEDAKPGKWDYWTPYFCSLRGQRNTAAFNADYLGWIFVLIFGELNIN
jgi:hypothetical protein